MHVIREICRAAEVFADGRRAGWGQVTIVGPGEVDCAVLDLHVVKLCV